MTRNRIADMSPAEQRAILAALLFAKVEPSRLYPTWLNIELQKVRSK